jgi:hypothetical protein
MSIIHLYSVLSVENGPIWHNKSTFEIYCWESQSILNGSKSLIEYLSYPESIQN